MTNWDKRFLQLAEHIAQWSKDPSTKVGAVIVRPDKTICSTGYNGFPKGMQDGPNWLKDREEKYSRIIHAEINAILHSKEDLKAYTLYVSPFMPCDRCSVQIIQTGIKRVVTTDLVVERWIESFNKTENYFKECGVELVKLNAEK